MVELPYGRMPYPIRLDGRDARVLRAPAQPSLRPLDEMIDEALEHPIGSAPIREQIANGARVTVIISDATRAEPRAAFLAGLRRHLPEVRWTIAIATGTHGPSRLAGLGVDLDGPRVTLPDGGHLDNVAIVDHDGHRATDLVTIGTTSRGTPVRVHRCIVDTDLVIATGCIRPHYFAGFGAGVKAIFPGLGEATAIRINHRLKTEPGSHAGCIDGNPCRDDLVEAVDLVATPTFLLDGVCDAFGRVAAVVAGELDTAFRAGVALARPWLTVQTSRAPLVIASDVLPISASLYQAAKIAAATAPLVETDGTLVLVAECANGVEPLDVVNEAIFRIGVLPRLAPGVSLRLVSSLAPEVVARTLLRHTASVDTVLAEVPGPVLVIPRSSNLLYEVS
jgi:nickel-dependent lactate racemase